MPVRKFRSAEEMNQVVWRKPGDPELYAAIAGIWELGRRINARRFPPGVYRYRSIEELDAQCRAWRDAEADRARSRN